MEKKMKREKKKMLSEKILLVGVRKREENVVDYYLEVPGEQRIYAFTKAYTDHSYRLCKGGIRINALMRVREKDKGIMRVVNYAKYIMPYLTEYYGLYDAA